jgi:8-oxo-dGTP pyrophosphatase MutT (NUDIX family)
MYDIVEKYQASTDQLIYAGQLAACRELYEETGIKIEPNQMDRIVPAAFLPRPIASSTSNDIALPPNEYKRRLLFLLMVTNADFPSTTVGSESPMGSLGKELRVRFWFGL